MKNLVNKRLVILGGIALSIPLVLKAKEMGIITAVVDYNDDSPAKKFSDESYLVDATNVESVVELCKQINADGLITTCNDMLLPYACNICNRLNFNFFIDQETLMSITNKYCAKQLFINNNLPVPVQYKILSQESNDTISNIAFPVLAKPVDSSGQKGITICWNEQELKEGIKIAKAFSLSKEVVVEEYISGDYVVICLTIQNGYLSLSAMADKPVLNTSVSKNQIKMPKGYIFPSKYISLFNEKYFSKFQTMAKTLNLKNGSWGVEAVIKNQEFFFFEMQYRLGGIRHEEFMHKENDIDLLQMHIEFALTGVFGFPNLISEKDNAQYRNIYCQLNILIAPGIITKIEGIDELYMYRRIVRIVLLYKEGDIIEETSTTMQIFGKISIEASTRHELFQTIDFIRDTLKIEDQYGRNQLLDFINEEDIAI